MSLVVVLDHEPLPERAQLAALLAQHAGLPLPVANKLAGRASGIVWEGAPDRAAQALAAALTACGYPARAVPESLVPAATLPRRVHRLALDGEHLGVHLRYSGPPEWIAWDDVLVISAAAFRTETTKVEVEVSVVGGALIQNERVQVDIGRDIVVELFALPLADRSGPLHVRLHCHEVNYAQSLGATIHEGWREKFALLVARLGLRAERALVSPQTEALLATGMQPQNCTIDPYFDGDQQFAAYNRWLLCRRLFSAQNQ